MSRADEVTATLKAIVDRMRDRLRWQRAPVPAPSPMPKPVSEAIPPPPHAEPAEDREP